jgi:hypothetical protein
MDRTRGVVRGVSIILGVSLVFALATSAQAHNALLWSAPATVTRHGFVAIRCPSASLCVAIDSRGDLLTTTTPGGGAREWRSYRLDRHLTAIACASASMCVAVDSGGYVMTSRHPRAGAGSWSRVRLDPGPGGELSAVTCRANLCITADGNGNLFATTTPGGAPSAWRRIGLPSNGDSPGIPSGFSCPLKTLCVGVDQSTGEGFINDVFTSIDPLLASAWKLTAEFTDHSFTAIVCPTRSMCVAPTADGHVITSTDPTRGRTWKVSMLTRSASINTAACPTTHMCLLGDDHGGVWASVDPGGGPGAWERQTVAPGSRIEAVACVSASLCLAGTADGQLSVGRAVHARP